MPEVILVIEDALVTAFLDAMPKQPVVVNTRFAQLDAEMMARVLPDCVVVPLFATGFDVPQVIKRLQSLGYRGRLCTLTPPLPERAMVEAEMQGYASTVVVQVVEIEPVQTQSVLRLSCVTIPPGSGAL